MLLTLQISGAWLTTPRVFGWTPSVSQKLGSQQTIMWRWPWYLWRNSRPTLPVSGISGCWCDRIWEPQKDAHFVAFLVSFLSKGPLGFTPAPLLKWKFPWEETHNPCLTSEITSAESLFQWGGARGNLEAWRVVAAGRERAQKRDELCQTQMPQIRSHPGGPTSF